MMKPLSFLSVRFFLILICVLCCMGLSAQKRRLHLSFAPLAMVDDISFPTVQVGVGYSITENIMLFSEFGIKYRRSILDARFDTAFVHSQGFKWKGEIRFYNWKKLFRGLSASGKDSYIGFNVFYTKDAHNNKVRYELQPDTYEYKTDNFGARKSVFGFNFLIGKQEALIGDRLVAEVYAGGGVRWRFRSTVNQDYDPEQHFLVKSRHPNLLDMRAKSDLHTGNSAAFNLTVGLRIFWSF